MSNRWEQLQRLERLGSTSLDDDLAVNSCPESAQVHLVFAHFPDKPAAAIDPWATLLAYGLACGPKSENARNDFVGACVLWLQAVQVKLTKLTKLRTTPLPTGRDGGTILELTHPILGPSSNPIDITVPLVPYFMRQRRVCLSIAGESGYHQEIVPLQIKLTTGYPSSWRDDALRLLSIEPSWRIQIKKGDVAIDVQAQWTDTPVGQSKRLGFDLLVNGVHRGTIVRYSYKSSYLYGLQHIGDTSTYHLADRYHDLLGHSRRIIFKAVRSIEGCCESVISYDGPKLSWGINQWNRAELWQILAYISDFYPDTFKDCFDIYGIRLKFAKRNENWSSHGTYTGIVLYRLPCCGTKVRNGLDVIHNKISANEHVSADIDDVVNAFALNQESDTTSYEMHIIFQEAGAVETIQKAQAEWMSFRISSIQPAGKKVDKVLDQFLNSLGSNVSASDRLTKAKAALGDSAASLLAEDFSDADASKDWVDWATRIGGAQNR